MIGLGYEIPISRHFCMCMPRLPLNETGADLAKFEREIAGLLRGLMA